MEQIEMKDTEQLEMLQRDIEKALLLAKLADQEKILKKRSYTLLYIIFALILFILLFIVTNINMLTGEGDDYVTIKTTTTDSTSVKKISIGEYIDDLSRENDSLQLALLQLKSENLRMRMDSLKLANIQKNYPIEIKEDGNTMWAESPKIDSALLLLHVYRDRIKSENGKLIVRKGRLITDEEQRDLMAFKLILKNYPIKVVDNGNVIKSTSPQIDSALLLLPYYRDKIKKLSDGSWEIVHSKTER